MVCLELVAICLVLAVFIIAFVSFQFTDPTSQQLKITLYLYIVIFKKSHRRDRENWYTPIQMGVWEERSAHSKYLDNQSPVLQSNSPIISLAVSARLSSGYWFLFGWLDGWWGCGAEESVVTIVLSAGKSKVKGLWKMQYWVLRRSGLACDCQELTFTVNSLKYQTFLLWFSIGAFCAFLFMVIVDQQQLQELKQQRLQRRQQQLQQQY